LKETVRNLFFIFPVLLSLGLLSCTTVPITGRSQLNLVSDTTMLSMSFQQYAEFIKTHELNTDQEQINRVQRVGERIRNAVEHYMAAHHMADELKDYRWEFNLIESDEQNAWAMPGGKVVIYSGILPVTRDDAGLAVVMGHEIAHVVAKHGNERMSHGLVTQMGGIALSTALSRKPQATRDLWLNVFGISSQVGFLLPYSRIQETEADRLGLQFMALAGYNPLEALYFWERMHREQSGQAPPELLSTHPSDTTRIQNIRAMIPEVMPYYQPTLSR
jgi:predicted Zn-dependent protease